jgi:hypothetical protein
MIVLDLSILNQKGTPMFNSDLTANRPAAGIVGRIFIAIDSPYGIFRDTGTGWDQISSVGVAATTIYNGDGTLTGTRTISSGGFQLVFNPQTTFFSSLTASTGASSFSVLGSNALSFASGFSSSNIGNVYSANGAINAQNFLGNATFAQANLASAMVNVNKIDFGSGGHTITMTQSTAPGIRAMTGVQNQIQFTGSHNGTISHAAISQNLGFYRESGSTRTLTITNAYSLLINPLDDYGSGFTFTNRWGIYQAGASDINYFAANTGIGTTSPIGKLETFNNSSYIAGAFSMYSNTASDEPIFYFRRGRGTLASPLTATTGDTIASIRFAVQYNSSIGGYNTNAKIESIVEATGANLIFYTNNGGIPNLTLAERMRITAAGRLLLGTSIENTFLLDVNGTAIIRSSANILTALSVGTSSNIGTFNVRGANDLSSGTAILVQNDSQSLLFAIRNNGLTYINPEGSGNVIVGSNVDTASAKLSIVSTTKGFLPPVMTNAQRTAISSPAVGLIVYCTDVVEGLYVYKSTGWTFII